MTVIGKSVWRPTGSVGPTIGAFLNVGQSW